MEFPSDAQKMDKIKLLIDNGFSERLLLSLDVHTKHRMVSPPIILYAKSWSKSREFGGQSKVVVIIIMIEPLSS